MIQSIEFINLVEWWFEFFYFQVWILNFTGNCPYLMLIILKLGHLINTLRPSLFGKFSRFLGFFSVSKLWNWFPWLGPFEIKWAAIGCLMFMQPLAHNNTIHTTKLWLMMPPKLQLISLPPYNLSPTRVKRFTYVDKTTFVSKKPIVNTWI